MARITFVLLCLTCIAAVRAQTVWKALQDSTEPISQFRALVLAQNQQSFLQVDKCSISDCPAIFIPTDAAMARLYPTGTDSLTAQQKTDLVKNHICHLLNSNKQIMVDTTVFDDSTIIKSGNDIYFGTDVTIGKFVTLTTMRDGGTLFYTRKKNGTVYTYYVNNAEQKPDTTGNIVAGGAFHIIHDVISPLSQSKSVVQFMRENPAQYSEFLKIYDAFKALTAINARVKNKVVTAYEGASTQFTTSFFIPENTNFDTIPTAVKTQMTTNATLMLQLLISHMAYNQLVFIDWTRNQPPINLKMELPGNASYNAYMYSENNGTSNYIACGGVTATVTSKPQPLKQAVLTRISRVLNFLYTDVQSYLAARASRFLTQCNLRPVCKNLLTSGNVTVFAPAGSSWTVPKYNTTQMDQFLLLHILRNQRLSTPEMRLGRVENIPNVGQLRFVPQDKSNVNVAGRLLFKHGQNGYEQGYVSAKITAPDLPGTNGLVHIIQNPLGYTDKSILNRIEGDYQRFSVLNGYLDQKLFDMRINLQAVPKDGQFYTFFAPTNTAFAKMTDPLGQKILADKNLRNRLLKELLALNVVVVSNLELGKTFQVPSAQPYENAASERVKINLRTMMTRQKTLLLIGEESETEMTTESAKIFFNPTESEMGCMNGIVYAIDTVPYGSKSVLRVCKPGTTCGGRTLTSGFILVFLLSAATAIALRFN